MTHRHDKRCTHCKGKGETSYGECSLCTGTGLIENDDAYWEAE